MQYKIISFILLALVITLAFYCFSLKKEEQNTSSKTSEKVTNLKQLDSKDSINSLNKEIKELEVENEALKKQVLELEKQQFLFRTTPIQIDKDNYKLDENLKFKEANDKLKENLEELNKADDNDEYKVNPSIDFNSDTRTIDGIKIEVETKF